AFDAALAHEFADDFRDRPSWQQGGTAWSMVAHSLRAGFQASVGRDGHSDGNDQLAAAILGCLGPDLFDPVGLPRSLWHIRLLHTADRVQDMIEELFAAERQKR
ncbi:MAG TPA: hypothetical protein PK867_13820, partial [Pirellulales bacterium]|nr:hypothetical protein [Pirellulales bacterium]